MRPKGEFAWTAFVTGVLLAYGGVLLVILLAWFGKAGGCDGGPCAHDTRATIQLIVALAGVIPLTAATVSIAVGRNRQGFALGLLTVAVYLAWWIVIGSPGV